MNTEVISESFVLTDAIKNHIHQNIEKVTTSIKTPIDIHVFIAKEAKHVYAVRFRTLVSKKTIFAERKGEDIYELITEVSNLFKQQILKTLKKEQNIDHQSLGSLEVEMSESQ